MSEDENNYTVDTVDSGASKTVSVEAGQIRKGGYIMIKGKPCKVKDISVSKTGTHGHAKCKFSATDIFTGNTCEELCPSTHSIDVPIVNKKDWMIQGIQEDTYVLLMDDNGEMREDLQLPNLLYSSDDDLKTSNLIKNYCELLEDGGNFDIYCTVISAVDQEKIIEVRKKDV